MDATTWGDVVMLGLAVLAVVAVVVAIGIGGWIVPRRRRRRRRASSVTSRWLSDHADGKDGDRRWKE